MNVDLRVKSGRAPPRGKRRASPYRMALAWRHQTNPARAHMSEHNTPGQHRHTDASRARIASIEKHVETTERLAAASSKSKQKKKIPAPRYVAREIYPSSSLATFAFASW